MYVWLHQLQLADCYQLFVQAGYDMPTISRMTPEVCFSRCQNNILQVHVM